MGKAIVELSDGRNVEVEFEGTPDEAAIRQAVEQQLGARGPQEQNAQDFVPAETTPAAAPKSTAQNIVSGAAKGVAETLAFPAEAFKGLAQAGGYVSGQDTSELNRVNPTQTLKDLLNNIGLDTEPDDGFAGNAAEAVAGGLTGLGAASRASGIFSAGKQRLMQNRLGTFAAEDTVASLAGAGAKTAAQDAKMSEGGATGLELAGNILGGYTASKFMAPYKLIQAGKESYAKRRQRSMSQATEIIKGAVTGAKEDPNAVIAALKENQGLGSEQLTAGPRSRSHALQSLERALLNTKGNASFADEYIQRGKTFDDFVHDAVKTNLGGEGVPDDFVRGYLDSTEHAFSMAEKSLQEATKKAAAEIAQLPPIEGLDYGKEVKTRLEETYDKIDAVQKEAWNNVPDATAVVQNSPLAKALEKIQQEDEPDPAKFPPEWAVGTIEKLAEQEFVSADKVQALRSSLLDSAREAGFKGQDNLARRLHVLAKGALETLNLAESSYPDKLAYARGISKELNERFSNDIITPLLAKSRSGGHKTPDNETMYKLFQKGPRGQTNFVALNAAFGGVPEEAKSYVLQQFNRQVMPTGEINVKQAENFLNDYRPLLDEAGLTDTVKAYVKHGQNVQNAADAQRALHKSTAKDAAAKVVKLKDDGSYDANTTGAQLVAHVQALINKPEGGISGKLTDLFRTATNIEEVEGLKTAIAEGAIKSLYTVTQGVSGHAPDRVKRLVSALETTGEYTAEQIENFSQIADAAYRQSQALKAPIFKGQSNTTQDTMRANVLSRLLSFGMLQASSVIKPTGPGALKFSAEMSSLGKIIGKKIDGESATELINQAFFDNELMIAILENPNSLSEGSRSKIRSVLAGIAKYTIGGTVQPSQAQIYGEMLEDDNGN